MSNIAGDGKCLFIQQRSPHGSVNPIESLDMAYTLAAFEHSVSFLFTHEGIFQILQEQNTEQLGFKDFALAFRAWEDYGIENIYVDQASLSRYAITPDQLLVPVDVLDEDAIKAVLSDYVTIFND